jgi:hypothetical protein
MIFRKILYEFGLYLLLTFVLGPLACLPSESIWKYGYYRQSVEILGLVISSSQGRYLHRTIQTQDKRGETSMPRMGFDSSIPVFERAKTFHALNLVATVVYILNEYFHGVLLCLILISNSRTVCGS